MCGFDRLCPLQVSEAGQHLVGVPVATFDEGHLQILEQAVDPFDCTAGVELEVGRNLVIPAAAGVQLATDVADPFELDANTVYACAAGTTKHIATSFSQGSHVIDILPMLDLLGGGEGRFAQRPFCTVHATTIVSPLTFAPDSLDQSAAWFGKDRRGRDHLIEQAGALSLRQGAFKFIEANKRGAFDKQTKTELGNAPQVQLYDVGEDPGETRNLAGEQAERAAAMAARLEALRAAGRSR